MNIKKHIGDLGVIGLAGATGFLVYWSASKGWDKMLTIGAVAVLLHFGLVVEPESAPEATSGQ